MLELVDTQFFRASLIGFGTAPLRLERRLIDARDLPAVRTARSIRVGPMRTVTGGGRLQVLLLCDVTFLAHCHTQGARMTCSCRRVVVWTARLGRPYAGQA